MAPVYASYPGSPGRICGLVEKSTRRDRRRNSSRHSARAKSATFAPLPEAFSNRILSLQQHTQKKLSNSIMRTWLHSFISASERWEKISTLFLLLLRFHRKFSLLFTEKIKIKPQSLNYHSMDYCRLWWKGFEFIIQLIRVLIAIREN